jgi:hypothetical protein
MATRARWPLVVLAIWLVAVCLLSVTGATQSLRPPQAQALVVALAAALILAYQISPAVRAWTASFNLNELVGFHLVRFVGFEFLLLAYYRIMPNLFAIPAGLGDVAVAVAAFFLVASGPVESKPVLARLWNIVGCADILLVLYGGARMGMADPHAMLGLLKFPNCVTPLFLVPLIIASHLLIFGRLSRAKSVEG